MARSSLNELVIDARGERGISRADGNPGGAATGWKSGHPPPPFPRASRSCPYRPVFRLRREVVRLREVGELRIARHPLLDPRPVRGRDEMTVNVDHRHGRF